MKFLIAVFLAFGLINCGQSSSTNDSQAKIIGGTVVNNTDSDVFKSTVALTSAYGGESFCTGTVVSARHIVTAAHCLQGVNFPIAVRFGNPQAGESSKMALRRVADIDLADYRLDELAYKRVKIEGKVYPATFVQPSNDIALLTLKSDIPSWAKVIPIQDDSVEMEKGHPITLAGFGWAKVIWKTGTYLGKKYQYPEGEGSGILREVKTQLLAVNGLSKELYVSRRDQVSCKGDSGGPAFVRNSEGEYELIGATSRALSAEELCEESAIYTDVRRFKTWIEEKMNK